MHDEPEEFLQLGHIMVDVMSTVTVVIMDIHMQEVLGVDSGTVLL